MGWLYVPPLTYHQKGYKIKNLSLKKKALPKKNYTLYTMTNCSNKITWRERYEHI